MDLVVDANILFAALITENATAEMMFKDHLHLYAPEFLLEEFNKHELEILSKTRRHPEELGRLLEILKRRIWFSPYSDFKGFIESAMKISPDPNDVEYIALAMSIGAAIWSNDKALSRLENIKVYSTSDLIGLFHP